MRAPASTRARMSRPSSSRPNGCATARPRQPQRQILRRRIERRQRRPDQRRQRRDDDDARAEPADASCADLRAVSRTITHSGSADRGGRRPVDQQVHRHVGDRDQQDAALHQRVVAEADRLNQQPADARPREDRLGDDRAGQHGAELQAEDRDDRDQAVAERVPEHGARARHAARPRRQHVELAQLLEHARARHPRQHRRQRRAERDRRQHQVRQRAAARHRQPAERHREHDRQQRPEPEVRHRDAEQRQRRRGVIDARAGPHRRDDPERDAR